MTSCTPLLAIVSSNVLKIPGHASHADALVAELPDAPAVPFEPAAPPAPVDCIPLCPPTAPLRAPAAPAPDLSALIVAGAPALLWFATKRLRWSRVAGPGHCAGRRRWIHDAGRRPSVRRVPAAAYAQCGDRAQHERTKLCAPVRHRISYCTFF